MRNYLALLIVIKYYVKQTHLLARTYGKHLLEDRVGEWIDDEMDKLQEVYIGATSNYEIARYHETILLVNEMFKEIPTSTSLQNDLSNVLNLYQLAKQKNSELIKELSGENGVTNELATMAQKIDEDIYLVRTQYTKERED